MGMNTQQAYCRSAIATRVTDLFGVEIDRVG